MVFRSLRASNRQGLGFIGGRPLPREAAVWCQSRAVAVVWGLKPRPRGDPTMVKTEQIGLFRHFESLVSRHLPDGEFGWGGISVTRQRRCPKASSVGTEISRGTQA